MTSTELYLRLLSHVRTHWRVFALGCLGMMIVAATEPALPALMKPLIEGTFIDKDPVLIRWMPVVIVALFAIRGAAAYVAAYSLGWVGNRLVTDLRNAMFAKLLAMPSRFYDEQPSGILISKLTFDVTQVTAGGNQRAHHRVPRYALDRRAAGVPAVAQLEADAVRAGDGAADRGRGARAERTAAPLEPRGAGGDGLHYPGDRGGHRRAQGGEALRRAGLRESALRPGSEPRAAPPDEAGLGDGGERADRATDRGDRAGGHRLLRNAAIERGAAVGGRVCCVRSGHAAAHRAVEACDRYQRVSPERARRRRERVPAHRPGGRA